jgi:OmpA-OmpF porin, OOP family
MKKFMQKSHILTVAALSVMSFFSPAQAEDTPPDDRWYIAPFGTFIKAGGDRGSDDGWGGGMGIGKMIDEHFNVEARGFWQGFGGNGGDWNLTGGTADVQYFPFRDTFSPYAVLGLGAMNTSHGGDSGTGFIGEAGVGFTYEVMDNFMLRSDVRYRYNNNFNAQVQPGTDEFHDMTVNVGFVIPFGEKPAAPVVAKAEPAPVPPPVEDCSTRDGDNDGVNDCDDKCPTTLSGVKVTRYGCWIVDVKFDNDKDIIKPEYYPNLDNAAKVIRNHPEALIEVQGHTSKTGGFQHNMDLSGRRARAVKEYLVEGQHLPNVTSRGYGWTRPIDTNDTEEGRANNRRVQLEVDGKLQSDQ